jgi:hypothetical protein
MDACNRKGTLSMQLEDVYVSRTAVLTGLSGGYKRPVARQISVHYAGPYFT